MNVSGELMDALNKEIDSGLQRAVKRCLANKRKTVRPEDL